MSSDAEEGTREPVVLHLQTLEDRVLYSAAPFPVEIAGDLVQEPIEPEPVSESFELITASFEDLAKLDEGAFAFENENSLDSIVQPAELGNGSPETLAELVVVDTSVENYEALVDDLLDRSSSADLQIHFIDSSQNGVSEITRLLTEAAQQGNSYGALHLVSHGQQGAVHLGESVLSLESFDSHYSDISQWKAGLAADADILIYGCDVAADESGQQLIDRISEVSGADVAASEDLTGQATLGGNWVLEYVAGSVETDVVFSSSIIEEWNSTLDVSISGEQGTSQRAVAFDYDGNRTIVESNDAAGSWDIFVSRRSNSPTLDGNPLLFHDGSDFTQIQVNDDSAGDHQYAVVGSAANGDFVVAWTRTKLNGDTEVLAKVFDAQGNVLVNQFKVASNDTARDVSVAMNQDGRWVIGWEQDSGGATGKDVVVAVYDRDGSQVTAAFSIGDDSVANDQVDVSVAINDNNEIFVGYGSETIDDVYGRFITASGTLSNEFAFDDSRYFDLDNVSVDLNNDGKLGMAFETKFVHDSEQYEEIGALILEYDSVSGDLDNESIRHDFWMGTNRVTYGRMFAVSGNDIAAEYAPTISVLDDVPSAFSSTVTNFFVSWEGQGTWEHSVARGDIVDGSGDPINSAAEFGDTNGDSDTDNDDFVSDVGVYYTAAWLTDSGAGGESNERSLQLERDQFGFESTDAAVSVFRDRSVAGAVWQQSDGAIRSLSLEVNQSPDSNPSGWAGLENEAIPFSESDFGYSDAENDAFTTLRIESLPSVGTLLLNGTPITASDLAAQPDGIEIDVLDIPNLSYQGPADVFGREIASFDFSVFDGNQWSLSSNQFDLTINSRERLWLSTTGDTELTSGIPGDGDGVVQLGGPDLQYGDNTVGDFSSQFTPNAGDLDGLHYVETDIELGSPAMQLNRGDVLFSIADSGSAVTLTSESGATISVRAGDIVSFRPTSGDFSTGEYTLVARVSQMYGGGPVPFNYDLHAFSLVEQDSIIGDKFVAGGSFIFADTVDSNDLKLLEISTTGSSSTGTISTLVDGIDVGISGSITGLEFIERDIEVPGKSLKRGSLLVSVNNAESVGTGEALSVNSQDVFVLELKTTNIVSGIGSGDASLFYDSSDVGVDPGVDVGASIDAIALLGNSATSNVNIANPATLSIVEDQTHRFDAADFVAAAQVSDLQAIVIGSLPSASTGELLLKNVAVVENQSISTEDLDFLVFRPVADQTSGLDSFEYRAVFATEVSSVASLAIEVLAQADDVIIGGGDSFDNVVTNEYSIATSVSSDQTQQSVTALNDGGYVVVWHSASPGGDQILLQRFDSNDTKLGSETVIGDSVSDKSLPDVTATVDGGYLVTWTQDGGASGTDIWAARYDASDRLVSLDDATSLGGSAQAIVDESSNQDGAVVSAFGDGGFAVAWTDDGAGQASVVARIYHEGFTNEVVIAAKSAGVEHRDLAIEVLDSDNFVVSWIRTTGGTSEVQFQILDINGVPVSSVMNAGAVGTTSSVASIARLEDGRFALVWTENVPADTTNPFKIAGAVFDSSGGSLFSGRQLIAEGTTADFNPEVAATGDGGFVVVYQDEDIDASVQSVVGQRFDRNFIALDNPAVLNQTTTGSQSDAKVTVLDGSGDFVAVWSQSGAGADVDLVGNRFRMTSTVDSATTIPLGLVSEVTATASDQIDDIYISDLTAGTRVFATNTSTGVREEVFGPSFNVTAYDVDSVELELPTGVTVANYQLNVDVSEDADTRTITSSMRAVSDDVTIGEISGFVRNDEGADGAIAGDSGLENVRVLLYREGDSGSPVETFTDSSGQYKFNASAEGDYFIVVDSKSIGAGLLQNNDDSLLDRVWAQQTYAVAGAVSGALTDTTSTDGAFIGGRTAGVSDDVDDLATAQHLVRRTVSNGDTIENVNFGFSFNVVTNVADAVDAGDPSGRSVQGSFRQFINNANYIAGANSMKFVPVVGSNQQTDADGDTATLENWWQIQVNDLLPTIFDSDTTLDGQAWNATSGGLVLLDENAFDVRNRFSGNVGNQGDSLSSLDAPELELLGISSLDYGLKVAPDALNAAVTNVTIENFAISGFGELWSSSTIFIDDETSNTGSSVSNVAIRGNVIGTGPNEIQADGQPTRLTDRFAGISIDGADNGIIENNFIGFNSLSGITFKETSDYSTDWTVQNNEIRGNGYLENYADGVDATSSIRMTIIRNVIWENHGVGIDLNVNSSNGSGSHVIERNSLFSNGVGTDPEGSGLHLEGNGSIVRYNAIYDNQYDGVTVSYWGNLTDGFNVSAGNLISQNSFSGNGEQAIDLANDVFEGQAFTSVAGGTLVSLPEATVSLVDVFDEVDDNGSGRITFSEADAYAYETRFKGDGLTPNDGTTNSGQTQNGIDHPEIHASALSGNVLTVIFETVPAGASRVEIYAAEAGSGDSFDGNDYGEGAQFLGEVMTSAMMTDVNGRLVATLTLSNPPASILSRGPVTALAMDGSNNTSEFGNNRIINTPAVASESTVQVREDQSYTFALSDFDFFDANGDSLNQIVISNLPDSASGVLRLNGVDVTVGQRIDAAEITAMNLVFVPAANSYLDSSFDFAVNDGVEDSPAATMNIAIASVNDAPTGANNRVGLLEGEVYLFSASDFGFSDDADAPSQNALSEIRISDFNGQGNLTLDGLAIDTGSVIAVADIPRLQYSFGENGFGTSVATVDFSVVDDGGTANGGSDVESGTHQIVIDVTGVNDAPAGSDGVVVLNEDTAHSFQASDFGFSDADDLPGENSFSQVQIVGMTGAGTLTFQGNSVPDNSVIDVADLGDLVYTPPANDSGTPLARLQFVVMDDGGTANGGIDADQSANEIRLRVRSVNDAPTGQDARVVTLEDTAFELTATDFGYEDLADGDALSGVRIVGVNGNATLTLDGLQVASNQVVDVADLSRLRFTPNSNVNGVGAGSIEFRVIDDGGTERGGVDESESSNLLTMDVTPVNDAPSGQNLTIGINEDSFHQFVASDFGFSDVDGDNFASVTISQLPGRGMLTLNGMAVVLGQQISVSEFDSFRFTPAEDEYGVNYAVVGFYVVDDGGVVNGGEDTDPSINFIQFDVASQGDAPNGNDNTITLPEDGSYSFNRDDFGFEDPGDNDAFVAIRVSNILGGGQLNFQGAEVTEGSLIPVGNIDSLVFTPAAEDNGANYASFDFNVVDDGADLFEALVANRMTLNVTSINDDPVLLFSGATVPEGTTAVVTQATSTDVDSSVLTYSLAQGDFDNDRFVIDEVTGEVRFSAAPDFYNPADVDGDNRYHIEVTVSDGDGGFDSKLETIEVTEVNQAPQFSTVAITQFENQRPEIQIVASDREGEVASFQFVGTANDNALFDLNNSTGVIRILEAPDFESPRSGNDNVYELDVQATDTDGASTVQRITYQVTNVNEAVTLGDDVFVDEGAGFDGLSIFTNDNGGQAMPADANVQIIEQPRNGIVTLNPDGTFTFTANDPGDAELVNFRYSVERGGETTFANVSLIPGSNGDSGRNDTESTNRETESDREPSTDDENTSGDESIDESDSDTGLSGPGQARNENESPYILSVGNASDFGADTENSSSSSFQFAPDAQFSSTDGFGQTYLYARSVDTGLLTNQLGNRQIVSGQIGLQASIESSNLAAIFWQELDSTKRDYFVSQLDTGNEALWKAGALSLPIFVVGLVTRAALIGVSLGATYSQPWWTTSFDFQPIIESQDSESIEQMVDG